MIWLKQLYLHFYCLPILEALAWILWGVGAFALLRRWLLGKTVWRYLVWSAVLLWLAAIVTCTLIFRSQDPESGALSWIPLHSYFSLLKGANIEVLRMNFMNTVLFYPLGLLANECFPMNWTKNKRLVCGACFALVLSCGIEIIQFFSLRGYAEMDDIIHNTAGMCLGVLTLGPQAHPEKREVGSNE